jgi:hypothetical protein
MQNGDERNAKWVSGVNIRTFAGSGISSSDLHGSAFSLMEESARQIYVPYVVINHLRYDVSLNHNIFAPKLPCCLSPVNASICMYL